MILGRATRKAVRKSIWWRRFPVLNISHTDALRAHHRFSPHEHLLNEQVTFVTGSYPIIISLSIHEMWTLTPAFNTSGLCKVCAKSYLHELHQQLQMYVWVIECEVKMAEYWPSSFFVCLWTETELRSINLHKKDKDKYLAFLTEQTCQ